MGLDMYAFETRTPIAEVDFESPNERLNIARWRKHPNLHGWMEALYYRKGGVAEDFNCVRVRLDAADIDALEDAVLNNRLPITTDRFYGESGPERVNDDLWFVRTARADIANGWFIYYEPNW